jgi:hypothetical protein
MTRRTPLSWGPLLLLLGAGLVPAFAAAPQKARPAAPAAVSAPRLAVIISVDGLSWERLGQYRPWYVAGLKRLLDEGQVESLARYRHINTETGPGHAALSTGAPPRVTGIVANGWFEQAADGSLHELNCVDVPPPGGGKGTVPGPGNLRVPTIGDRLVEARPASRVVSVSGKDRGAMFLAGRNRQHTAYWFDRETGRFVTSVHYDPPAAAKAVVAAYNRAKAGGMLPTRFGLTWKPLPPPEPESVLPLARPTPAPRLAMLDYQLPTLGLGWDHALNVHPRGYFTAVNYSPFIDTLAADLALELLGDSGLALGRRDAPDLLEISFSAQDLVAHGYGPESEENLDVLRRLDLHLGRLMNALEAAFPKGSVVIAFSADHGFPPIPEAEKARNPAFTGGRLVYGERTDPNFLERLNRALSEELCLADGSRPLFGSDGWNVIYNRPALPMRGVLGPCGPAGRAVAAAEIDRALPKVAGLLYREELRAVYLASERERWPAEDPVTEFVRNDFDPERSGDAVLVPRPGVMTHWDPARGTMHGSIYEYDTHVPLIFWGGPFRAGVSSADATPYDLAPTLAELLSVKLPDAIGHSRLPAR